MVGHVSCRAEADVDYLNVRFGLRRLRSGRRVLAVWLPDLQNASKSDRQKWLSFLVPEPLEFEERDTLFESWQSRYIKGSFDEPIGQFERVGELLQFINSLTTVSIGSPLFLSESVDDLIYPTGSNDQSYLAANLQLSRLLVDGISYDAIVATAAKLGITLVGSSRAKTLQALKLLLTKLPGETSDVYPILDELRSRRSRVHAVPNGGVVAQPDAFEVFYSNVDAAINALEQALYALAQGFNVSVESATRRRAGLSTVPNLTKSWSSTVFAAALSALPGKTVASVQIGDVVRESSDMHHSEALIVTFDDGSMLIVDTMTNARNLADAHGSFEASDVNVSLSVDVVPPLHPYAVDIRVGDSEGDSLAVEPR